MLKENLRTLALVVAGSIVGSFVGCVATVHYYEGRIESVLNSTFGPISPDSLEREYQQQSKTNPASIHERLQELDREYRQKLNTR